MADYTAVFLPGTAFTLELTGDDVLSGDPLEVGDPAGATPPQSGTCQRATAGTPRYIGIAGHDCRKGMLITVVAGKTVHQGPAEGPIATGEFVAASGTDDRQVVVEIDPPLIIGMALTTAAADGDICRWIQR